MNSHSPGTPEASQRAELLRCPYLAILQALDEDDVKNEQTACKREIVDLHSERFAVSPGDLVANNDRPMDDVEALLSCHHATPKYLSETQIPGLQFSALALERPIAIAHRPIAVPDCIHFLLLQKRKRHQLKIPSMRSPGGRSISREVIVGQRMTRFQGGIVK